MKTQKQIERQERARARADKLERAADSKFAAARAAVEHIPLGQPILVGHHSERHHRRDLAKRDRLTAQACELAREADAARWSAGLAGRAVMSDDPEAIDALRAKLAKLQEQRARNKKINAAWRKGGEQALREIGLGARTAATIAETMRRCPWLDSPMSLTNLGAEVRRVEKRIAELEAGPPAFETIEGDGWTIEALVDEHRIAVSFRERRSPEFCQLLKRNGWRWSPTRSAWVRMLNAAGVHRARELAAQLGTETKS